MEVLDSMYVLPDPNKLYSSNEILHLQLLYSIRIQIIKKNFDKDKLNYEDMKNFNICTLHLLWKCQMMHIYDSFHDEYLIKNTIDRSAYFKIYS